MIPEYLKLSNEDNMKLMKRYPDGYFDLAYIDPEYGIGASKPSKKPHRIKQKNGTVLSISEINYKAKEWDSKPASSEFGKEVKRVSKNQFIWGANFFDWIVGTPFEPPRRDEFEKFISENPIGWVLWDKCNGTSDQYDCELAWTSFDTPSEIYKYMWAGMMQGSQLNGEVQEGNKKLNEKRIHPTQKPMKVNKWALLRHATPFMKILDTGTGSGGSAIAVDDINKIEKLNLEFVGCELDKEYFDASIKRISTHTSQLTLI
jgi:site-specific DNA-methyltransferase (adenine-specific)